MRAIALPIAAIFGLSCQSPSSSPPPDPVTVTVPIAPVLLDIVIADAGPVFSPGEGRQLAAVGRYANGAVADVTAAALWSSSAPTVLELSPGGRAQAGADGQATVSATISRVAGRAEVLVAHRRQAFVTTAAGTGDLATWPDAGGAVGARAGDAVCQARARAVGLPGGFRAWLSDSRDDAYCRLLGLGGQVTGGCGSPELPVAAGPWFRRDGRPFASADLLLLGVVSAPAGFDEAGAAASTAPHLTGSSQGARVAQAPPPCADWTSAAPAEVAGGSADATARRWESGQQVSCAAASHLLCLEEGQGAPWPTAPAVGQRVFVTSARGPGALGDWPQAQGTTGTAAGDAICANLARAAGLRGVFKAWLGAGGAAAADRLAGEGPWVSLDGQEVARDRGQLAQGRLFTPITVTEAGGRADVVVWTGMGSGGRAAPENCGDWARGDPGTTGQGGLSAFATPWTTSVVAPCGNAFALYCFEQ